MKKNYSMRIASMLLVLVLLTTCVISGTFAKYVTSDTGSDSAQVAKWGVKVEADGELFAQAYDDNVVAASGATYKLVAPGTSGTFANFTVTGTPEVEVEVTYEATVTLSGWAVTGDDFYCPIVVKVNGATIDGDSFNTVSEFVDAIETAIEGAKKTYAANVNLSEVNDDLNISWEWALEGNDDVKDTALGDAAAAGNASTIAVEVKCTVTQIQ